MKSKSSLVATYAGAIFNTFLAALWASKEEWLWASKEEWLWAGIAGLLVAFYVNELRRHWRYQELAKRFMFMLLDDIVRRSKESE